MHLFAFSAYMDTEQRDACCNFILSSRERKEPRGDAAAATVCGPRSLASGLAAGGDEERGPSLQQIACLRRVLVEFT